MQKRSFTYQAVISNTMSHAVEGIPFQELVKKVAFYVDSDRATAFRLGKLKRMPSETDAETIIKGKLEIARRYIDAARRQGLIHYAESAESQSDSKGRYVFWSRFARNGGRYGTSEAREELRRHQDFMSDTSDDRLIELGANGTK